MTVEWCSNSFIFDCLIVFRVTGSAGANPSSLCKNRVQPQQSSPSIKGLHEETNPNPAARFWTDMEKMF